jgi:HD-GYP domain-containing protein (c-di-GMP phosphodiesterase class II)
MTGSRVRVADVLGALSFATDVAAGVPIETSLRTCAVAVALAHRLRLDDGERATVFYVALLRHIGCTSFAHEAATFAAGDDHGLLRTFEGTDRSRRVRVLGRAVRHLASRAPLGARTTAVLRMVTTPSAAPALMTAHCEQAAALATDMGMDERVIIALGQIYERYDGRGEPQRRHGEDIALAARLLHVASTLEIQRRQVGRVRAIEEIRARRGGHLDPNIVDALLEDAETLWPLLEAPSVWDAYLDAEPAPRRLVGDEGLEQVTCAFGRYADLKCPMLIGHSPAVASLAAAAARAHGLGEDSVRALSRAGLLHDLGIVSVPNGIWEKKGPLNVAERERVEMHAYFTSRILSRVPALGDAALIAAAHHERLDGSGYPRRATDLASPARILAAADVMRALVETRPHRPAYTTDRAVMILRDEAREGRLCARAVESVIAASGLPRSAPRRPAGLTEREVEVLVEVARGRTNKEIAAALGISPRTVQHHVEHLYEKTGLSTRAAAALFAVRHGLVPTT